MTARPVHFPREKGPNVLIAVVAGLCIATTATRAANGDDPATAQGGEADKGTEARSNEARPQTKKTEGLTAVERHTLEDAAERGETVTVEAIVIAAIARSSDRVSAIVRDAVTMAPGHAQRILDAASNTFPELKDRLTIAVNQTLKRLEGDRIEMQPIPEPDVDGTVPAPKTGGNGTTGAADATTSTEPMAPASAWSGELALSGSRRSGATDSLEGSLDAVVGYTDKPWTHDLELVFDYAGTEDVINERAVEIRGRSRRDLSERLYGFGEMRYQDDRFSGFAYRVTEAVGLGYGIVETDSLQIDVEGGPALRQSRIRETGAFTNEVLLRTGTRITWRISDTATFTNETSLLMATGGIEFENEAVGSLGDRSTATNVSALDVQIVGNLEGRLSVELDYRSDPPPGGVHTETLSKAGLVYRF